RGAGHVRVERKDAIDLDADIADRRERKAQGDQSCEGRARQRSVRSQDEIICRLDLDLARRSRARGGGHQPVGVACAEEELSRERRRRRHGQREGGPQSRCQQTWSNGPLIGSTGESHSLANARSRGAPGGTPEKSPPSPLIKRGSPRKRRPRRWTGLTRLI